MNPLMIAQFALPLLSKLAKGGKLKDLVGGDNEDAVKTLMDVFGDQAAAPDSQVLGALAVLAEHAPATDGAGYAQAIGQVLEGLTKIKAAVAAKETKP